MKPGKVSYQETSLFTIGVVRWLLILLAVLLFQFGLSYPALLLVLLLALTALGRLWSRYGIRDIEIKNDFYPPRLFAGETTSFTVQLYNKKLLPVVVDYSQTTPGIEDFTFSSFLPWWGKASQEYTLTPPKRGYYEFPPASLIASDGMGFYKTQMTIDSPLELIVYPPLVSLSELGLQVSDLIGEKADHRYILPDPIQVAGLRLYTPDIPARLINWKASARQDQLMARVIEPTADYKLCLLLDMDVYKSDSNMETAISLLASIAMEIDKSGIPYGVIVNGKQCGLPGPVSVPVASGLDHTMLVMEKLARLTGEPAGSLDEILSGESGAMPWGTSLVLVGKSVSLSQASGGRRFQQIDIPAPSWNGGCNS